jgi:signal recognition particle subunit SRP19
MRKRDGIIIWPAYFEKNFTRAEGRRIPSNLASENVSIDILREAAESTGFEFELESGKRYPRSTSRGNGGYLLIKDTGGHKKKRILLMLAKGVRKVIAKREAARQAATKKKGKKRHRR